MGKKKTKKVKKPKPIRMPEKANEQWETIKRAEQELMRQLTELNAKANLFLRGMRLGLGVPDDWGFDTKTQTFTPPKKEKKDGKD